MPTAASQPFDKKLETAVAEFNSKKSTADRFVVKQFGKYRRAINGNKALSKPSRAEMRSIKRRPKARARKTC